MDMYRVYRDDNGIYMYRLDCDKKDTYKTFKSVLTKDGMELRFTITRDLAHDRSGENILADKV